MQASKTKNSIFNLSAGIILQFISIIVSFIGRSFFIKYLSEVYLGIAGLFSNILVILAFFELGIGSAVTYALYKPLKENDKDKIISILNLYKRSYRVIGIVVFLIGFVIMFFIKYMMKEVPDIPENIYVIYLLYLANPVLSYFLSYKKSILYTDQKNYIINFVQQISTIIQVFFNSLFLYLTRNIYIYLIINVITVLLNNIICSIYVNIKYPYVKNKTESVLTKQEKKNIFVNIKDIAMSKISSVIANGTDNIIISKVLGLTSVGVVSNYQLIINSVNNVLWAGLSSVTGTIGNFNIDSTVKERQKIFSEVFLAAFWLYAFASVAILSLANPFIELWIGEKFSISYKIVFALVVIIYVNGISYPAYSFRITMGYFKQLKYFYLAGAVFNLILSIILAEPLGLFGVFIATSISRLLTTEMAEGYYVSKLCLEQNPLRYYIKYIAYFAVFVINSIITKYVVEMIPVGGILGLIIKAFVCIIVSNLIFILFFFKTKAFSGVMERIKYIITPLLNKIKNKNNN